MSGVEGLVRAWCVRVGVGRYWLVRAWCVRVGVGRHCLVQASSPCLGAAPRAPFFISVSAGCEPLLWRGWGFGCRSVTAQGQTGGRAEGVLLGPALHIVHRRAALPPPTAAPSTPGHSPFETRAHSQATRCTRPHPPHTRPTPALTLPGPQKSRKAPVDTYRARPPGGVGGGGGSKWETSSGQDTAGTWGAGSSLASRAAQSSAANQGWALTSAVPRRPEPRRAAGAGVSRRRMRSFSS